MRDLRLPSAPMVSAVFFRGHHFNSGDGIQPRNVALVVDVLAVKFVQFVHFQGRQQSVNSDSVLSTVFPRPPPFITRVVGLEFGSSSPEMTATRTGVNVKPIHPISDGRLANSALSRNLVLTPAFSVILFVQPFLILILLSAILFVRRRYNNNSTPFAVRICDQRGAPRSVTNLLPHRFRSRWSG